MNGFTITAEQMAALNALPPGIYVVCGRCHHFHPGSDTFTINSSDEGILCEFCDRWGRCPA